MVYNYTIPRAPIAAMYSSPGPCYGLPGIIGQQKHDPRSVHYKGPAYPFGLKHGKYTDQCSPGPAYHPGEKIYRSGRDGIPAYSLSDRPKTASSMRTPGPGAYSPENSDTMKQVFYKPAAYSFGLRNKHRKSDKTPAPNAYTLDPMLGKTTRAGKKQAPCYSMRPKSSVGAFFEDLAKTPGPGTYRVARPDQYNNKPKAPGYSMTSRNAMPGDSTQKPGPGAHAPERHLYAVKRTAPKSSFGIKHSPYTAPLIVDPCF